jgi:hypothetical protein
VTRAEAEALLAAAEARASRLRTVDLYLDTADKIDALIALAREQMSAVESFQRACGCIDGATLSAALANIRSILRERDGAIPSPIEGIPDAAERVCRERGAAEERADAEAGAAQSWKRRAQELGADVVRLLDRALAAEARAEAAEARLRAVQEAARKHVKTLHDNGDAGTSHVMLTRAALATVAESAKRPTCPQCGRPYSLAVPKAEERDACVDCAATVAGEGEG